MEYEKIETVLKMLFGFGAVKVKPIMNRGSICITLTLPTSNVYHAELDYLSAEAVIRNFLRFVLEDLYETWDKWKDVKAYK